MARVACSQRYAVVLLASITCLLVSISEAQRSPPVVRGLSYTFYKSSCPGLESIIRNHLKEQFKRDVGLAAGLLRIHFHDCFVQVRDSFSSACMLECVCILFECTYACRAVMHRCCSMDLRAGRANRPHRPT